jgi:hypothetical protein
MKMQELRPKQFKRVFQNEKENKADGPVAFLKYFLAASSARANQVVATISRLSNAVALRRNARLTHLCRPKTPCSGLIHINTATGSFIYPAVRETGRTDNVNVPQIGCCSVGGQN